MELAAEPENNNVSVDDFSRLAKTEEQSPGFFSKWKTRISRSFDFCCGLIAMVIGLAIISAIPILNFLSLGYLLEASARVVKTGKIRGGFIGVRDAAILGKIMLGIWLWMLPVRLLYSYWRDAELMAPNGAPAEKLQLLLSILIVLVSFHLAWACIRGGKIRDFIWPAPLRFFRWLGAPDKWENLREISRKFIRPSRFKYYFLLGSKGFFGALLWLAIPVIIMMSASQISSPPLSVLVSLIGGILLGIATLFIPFIQTKFAVTGNFREFLSFRSSRDLFRKAPLAFWLALFITLLFAVPLYALKIELAPQEIFWLANIVFIIFIFPARLLVGWAVSRAMNQDTPRKWVSRWFATLIAIPVVGAYVVIVWSTQYLSWYGSLGLLEQHAFLVPAPLFGL